MENFLSEDSLFIEEVKAYLRNSYRLRTQIIKLLYTKPRYYHYRMKRGSSFKNAVNLAIIDIINILSLQKDINIDEGTIKYNQLNVKVNYECRGGELLHVFISEDDLAKLLDIKVDIEENS